jgi:uncharacterized protein
VAWRDFAPFTSSNVASIRYDEDQSLLEVTFHNGGTYQYYDVPTYIAQQLEQADSKGSFLASAIKGNFRYSRV